MRRLLFCLLIAVAPWPAEAEAQTPADTIRVDLQGAIRMALADSPEVAIEEAGVDFARARLQQALAARYATSFTLTTAHALAPALDIPEVAPPARDALYLDPRVRDDWASPRPYNQVDIELLQPLVTWGELSGSIRAARAGVEVERAAAAATAGEVALRTGELVQGLAAANELVRLAAEAEDVLDQARRELTRLLDDGDPDVSDADLFQLRLFEQELRSRRVEAEERRALAASALARQLRVPGAAVQVPLLEPIGVRAEPLEAGQAQALGARSEIQQAAAGVRARQALLEVARSDLYPKLFAGATFSGRYAAGRERQPSPFITDPYLGAGLRAGVGIRQNLSFLQTRARVAQAAAQLNEVRFQQEAAEQFVLFQTEEAYRNLTIAAANLEARTEAMGIAGEWLRTEQINFDLGLGEVRELVAAAQADLETRLRHVDAVRAYNVALLRLAAARGTLARDATTGTLFDLESGD